MKLVVFDIDGTLIRPIPAEDGCYLEALERCFGLVDVDSDWSRYSEVTDSGLVSELCRRQRGRAPDTAEMARFRSTYSDLLLQQFQPGHGGEIPGASAFLAGLREKEGWEVAIATGNFREVAVRKLRHAQLPCLDLEMSTADDSPDRTALIQLAIENAQVRYDALPEHVVYVGDAPWDLSAAREAGVPFLAVGSRCQAPLLRTIQDYTEEAEVERRLEQAVCW